MSCLVAGKCVDVLGGEPAGLWGVKKLLPAAGLLLNVKRQDCCSAAACKKNKNTSFNFFFAFSCNFI